MVKKLFPGGKRKAFVLTYDDGVEQDVRFIELLSKYGLRGSFNLNSALMTDGFTWRHECGMVIRRLPPADAVKLYAGQEVASHSKTHPYLTSLPREAVYDELYGDKRALEDMFGRAVDGFALPFTDFNGVIKECAIESGFSYARISDESRSYSAGSDKFELRAGLFHLDPGLDGFVDGFLQSGDELAVCMIVGHSYDLEVYGLWGKFDELFSRVAAAPDVCNMTVAEYVGYIEAMKMADVCGSRIKNNSDIELFFEVDGRKTAVAPRAIFC